MGSSTGFILLRRLTILWCRGVGRSSISSSPVVAAAVCLMVAVALVVFYPALRSFQPGHSLSESVPEVPVLWAGIRGLTELIAPSIV